MNSCESVSGSLILIIRLSEQSRSASTCAAWLGSHLLTMASLEWNDEPAYLYREVEWRLSAFLVMHLEAERRYQSFMLE